jgi:colanic acid biosynthesis protein WcaH
MKKKTAWVPEALYKKILAHVPLPCTDIVIMSRGKFLLGKRKNKPAQGTWWFVGGRVNKGERMEAAVRRHIKTETGVSKVKIKKQLGARETIFKNSAQGPASHTINVIFLAEIPYVPAVIPADSENSEMRWFSKIDPKWPGYVKDMLKIAGFK